MAPRASTLPSGRESYRDLADYAAELRALAAARPDRVRLVTIGRSREGRPIEGVEIAEGVARTDDGRPASLAVGVAHAREWTSGEMVMELARQLTTDITPRAGRIRARTRTFLFPVLNPDGFERSRTVEPMLRTNTAGVDLNRNFGAYWGGPDGSDTPGSERYRGPEPFSEPESRALRDFVATQPIAVVNSMHSYGGSVLYQPGFRRTSQPLLRAGRAVPGREAFVALARRMAAGAGYVALPSYEPRDITGATEDGMYFNQFASAFTVEVGYDEFQPPYDAVIAQYPRVGEALLRAAEAAADRSTHAVLRGRAPAGARLRLRRRVGYPTSYVVTGTDGASPRQGSSRTLTQRYTAALTVPASGRFRWHVNPSQRPLAILAGRREAWTLKCGSQRRRIVLRRAQVKRVALRCRA